MTVALFSLVVILAAALVVQSAVLARFVRSNAEIMQVMGDSWRQDTTSAVTRQSEMFLINLRAFMGSAQDERRLLYRTLISRTAGEFATLERIAGAPVRVAGERPRMTEAEYLADLERDMREGLGSVADPDIPSMPHGL